MGKHAWNLFFSLKGLVTLKRDTELIIRDGRVMAPISRPWVWRNSTKKFFIDRLVSIEHQKSISQKDLVPYQEHLSAIYQLKRKTGRGINHHSSFLLSEWWDHRHAIWHMFESPPKPVHHFKSSTLFHQLFLRKGVVAGLPSFLLW